MSRNKLISRGFIYICVYIVLCAVSNVYINHTSRAIEPMVSLLYTSVFTVVFFSIFNLKQLTHNIALIRKNGADILWLNGLNAIIWFVAFFCLKYLSPSLFSCLFLGAIPMSIFFMELRSSKASAKQNITFCILLLAMIMLMLLLAFQDVQVNNTKQIVMYGAAVVCLGGGSAAFIMKISRRLALKDVPAPLVVSVRFYGLIAICLVFIVVNPSQFLVSPSILFELFLLALITMGLPLLVLQKALKTTPALHASIIITVIPVVTYFFQGITGYYRFSWYKLAITIVFTLVLGIVSYVKQKKG